MSQVVQNVLLHLHYLLLQSSQLPQHISKERLLWFPTLFISGWSQYFHIRNTSQYTVAKTWKQPESIDRWMDQDVVYAYDGMLLRHEKWTDAICNNMNGPRDYDAQWGKSERQIPYDITCMWNLKQDTGELIYKQKRTHRYREQTWCCWEWVREGWTRSLGLADANYYI